MEIDDMARKPRGYWTHERLAEEAAKYQFPGDFKKANAGAYSAARKRGMLDEICGHMLSKYEDWTHERLAEEAAKYDFRWDFKKANTNAYSVARRRGILDEICGHMLSKYDDLSCEKLVEEAAKYSFRGDFKKGNASAYAVAIKRGILDEICQHMPQGRTLWTDEMLRVDAAGYECRMDFANGSAKAYSAARHRGLLDYVCGHMSSGNRVTSADRTYIELIVDAEAHAATPGDCSLIKIGITSQRRPDGKRQSEWAGRNNMTCHTLMAIDCNESDVLECLLHDHPLTVPAEMLDHVVDGRTEFRIIKDTDIKAFIADAIALAA